MKITTINCPADFYNITRKGNVCAKFSASWCGPCKTLTNTINHLTEDKIPNVSFIEIDASDEDLEEINENYNIRSLPALILFKDGKEIKRNIGNIGETDLITFLNSFN